MSEEKKEEQAFKDFKKSISVGEFQTIYRICEERYSKLSKMLESREAFVGKILEQVDENNQHIEDMPDNKKKEALEGLQNLMKALGRKGDRKMYKNLKNDVHQARYLTEFLNRFKATDDQLDDLDFSFLKKIANEN
jgi:hypothetical protein